MKIFQKKSRRYDKPNLKAISMCGNKGKFKNRKQAALFLAMREIPGMHPYDCPYCGHIHIGHGELEY